MEPLAHVFRPVNVHRQQGDKQGGHKTNAGVFFSHHCENVSENVDHEGHQLLDLCCLVVSAELIEPCK